VGLFCWDAETGSNQGNGVRNDADADMFVEACDVCGCREKRQVLIGPVGIETYVCPTIKHVVLQWQICWRVQEGSEVCVGEKGV
jgi:hypothetical protein